MRKLSGRVKDDELGFTLIELLVVMIIIGILAAIAIPIFLNQRKKAVDTATKSDVSRIGKEVATYWVGGTGPLTLDFSTPGSVKLVENGSTTVSTVALTSGTTSSTYSITSDSNWCVSVTNPRGLQQTYQYSATGGLASSAC